MNSDTKVLNNLHICCDDLDIKTFFLRYLDTVSKEGVTLIGHWEKTFEKYQIDKKKLSGFTSDQALYYVPHGMSLSHIPCGTHSLGSCPGGFLWIYQRRSRQTHINFANS